MIANDPPDRTRAVLCENSSQTSGGHRLLRKRAGNEGLGDERPGAGRIQRRSAGDGDRARPALPRRGGAVPAPEERPGVRGGAPRRLRLRPDPPLPVRPGSLSPGAPEGRWAGGPGAGGSPPPREIPARGHPVSASGGSHLSPEVSAAGPESPHLLRLPLSPPPLLQKTGEAVREPPARGVRHRHLRDGGGGKSRRGHPVRRLEGRVLPFFRRRGRGRG